MKRAVLLGFLGTLWLAQGASAQDPSAAQPPPPAPKAQASTPATTQTRPDAKYPNPSGQDSQQRKTAPKKAAGSAPGNGTVELRRPKTSDQSAASQGVAKQKAYTGQTGKKADPGTACSTARPTRNGGVDCGMGGKGATPGKVPK
jgi:hypothetical protein